MHNFSLPFGVGQKLSNHQIVNNFDDIENNGPTYMRAQERHVLQSVEELVAEAVQQGKEGYAAVELRKVYQALARATAFLRE
ncbi:MAG: hypothetical protein EBV86_03765 [Marivivens sp.]|nr:hypothetical protein [Marivivens sp.]